jgi:hypothetical protein
MKFQHKLLYFTMASGLMLPFANECRASSNNPKKWEENLKEEKSSKPVLTKKTATPLGKFEEVDTKKKSTKLKTPQELTSKELNKIFSAKTVNKTIDEGGALRMGDVAEKVTIQENLLASHKCPPLTEEKMRDLLTKNPEATAVIDEDETRSANTLGQTYDSVMGIYYLYNKHGALIPNSKFVAVFSKKK